MEPWPYPHRDFQVCIYKADAQSAEARATDRDEARHAGHARLLVQDVRHVEGDVQGPQRGRFSDGRPGTRSCAILDARHMHTRSYASARRSSRMCGYARMHAHIIYVIHPHCMQQVPACIHTQTCRNPLAIGVFHPSAYACSMPHRTASRHITISQPIPYRVARDAIALRAGQAFSR